MKKLLSYIILLSFLGSSNLTFVFANTASVLDKEIQNTQKILDGLEGNLSNILENAGEKIKNQDVLDKIDTKKDEIKELIEQTKEELQEVNSSTELKQKVQEVQNTLVLKAVSSLTPTTDTTENLENQIVIKTIEQKKQAKESLIESLKTGDDYRVMIRSSQNQEKTLELLKKFDTNIQIEFLYEQNEKQIFELIITQNSLLQKELFENIDTGEIPNNLLGIEVIKPELLQIGDIDFSGEETERLWGLKKYNISKYQTDIKLQTLKNGNKLKVGIIDTGIDFNHPDLKENIHPSLGYNFIQENTHFFDDQGHGTHVAGTIAGAINGAGVFGVNPNIELIPLKICDSAGFCPTYGVIKSLQYATENKLDILNMSLGAKGNTSTSPICSAIKEATSAGIIVVAASGNSNIDTSRFVPGGCSEAITVGAVDENLNRAMFSNFGEKVDISAPGVGIYSTYPNNGYKSLNGTSMATPYIVGVISMLKTYNKDLKTQEIKQLLKNNSFPVISESGKTMPGFVDMEKLMTRFIKNENTPIVEVQEIKQEEIKEENKEIKQEIIQSQPEETQVKDKETENTPSNNQEENIAIIDESIGLVIQEEETTQINSVEESELSSEDFENVQEDSTQINSESTNQEVGVIDENLVFTNEEDIEEETTQINSVEDKELTSENFEDIEEETTQINSENVDEVFEKVNNVEVGDSEELEDTSEESEEQTGIQGTYYCTMMVGGNCVYNFSGANSYSYTVSVGGIISLGTSSSQFRVTGSRAGNTTLYIKQNGREIHRVYVTVNNPKNLVISTSSLSIQNGNTATFTIRDGNGGYTTTSNNTSIATVSLNGTTVTISAKAVGSTTITVRDSIGKQLNLPVTITAKDLRVDTTSISLLQGNNGYINITRGNGGYSITRDNNNVTLYANGTTGYRVYANTPGTTRLQIRDSAGRSVNITVTITAPRNLVISMSSVSIQNGNTATFTIRDGNGGYTATSNNTSIATVSLNGTTVTISARAVGSTIINVKDKLGKQLNLPVTITAKALTLDKTTLTIDEKTSGYINITSGNGGYSITRNNTNVSVYTNGSTGYRVYGEKSGSSILNIKDSAGKAVSVSVVVREAPIKDIMKSYEILQIMANNGFWNDGYINEYRGKTRVQIEVQAKIFAEKLFTYKMNYDTSFKNAYNTEVNNQISQGGTKSDIEKGIKDGVIEGTKDYLMSYYDTIKNLTNLSFESVSNGVSSVWNIIKNPSGTLTTVANSFQELYNIFLNIGEIVSGLESYKKAYYPSYLGTNFGLSLIPVGKLKIIGGSSGETKSIKEIKYWDKVAFIDKNTILGNAKLFTNTGRIYKGGSSSSKIYKNTETGNYYYRDPAGNKPELMHNHLEVFDKKYNHIGIADPLTGKIDYSKAVSGRSIKDIMK